MKIKHKNGNQALTNVPFSKEISPTQKLKKLLLCREPGGALGKGSVPSVGYRHRRLLCRRPQLALGKGQSTGLNPGQRLCRELRRGPSAQVASVPTASRRSRRHSGRQPKCDGARSFSDGAHRVEGWLSAKR
jgi:hypothetical protein